jgi:RNA polymerase sigma factor (sigma-70 family)
MGEPTARAAFEDFYVATLDPVYRAVLLVTRHPARAQDAVHDAFLRALQRWDVVSQHPNPKAWLTRVALNSSVSAWRVWRREQSDPPPASVEDELPIDPILLRTVWRLPKRQRQVVALRVLLDLGQDQTAELLGIAPGTVGLHLHRALSALRASLTALGYSEIEG